MHDENKKNNNLELQKGNSTVESEIEMNSQPEFLKNLSFSEVIQKNFETLYQKEIFSTDDLITYSLHELARNKDQFIQNQASLNDLIFKTNHNLPDILINKKVQMHDFLTSFINEFKSTSSMKDSFTKAVNTISSDLVHDFAGGINKSDNLVPAIRKFRDFYISVLLMGKDEIHSIYDFKKSQDNDFKAKIMSMEPSYDLNKEVTKLKTQLNTYIKSRINKINLTKANEIESFCLAMDLGKLLTTRKLAEVKFSDANIKIGNANYELSIGIVKTYKYLFSHKDSFFTLKQLQNSLQVSPNKLSLKSLFGDMKKDNYKIAFTNLVEKKSMQNNKNTEYKWK